MLVVTGKSSNIPSNDDYLYVRLYTCVLYMAHATLRFGPHLLAGVRVASIRFNIDRHLRHTSRVASSALVCTRTHWHLIPVPVQAGDDENM